MKSKFYNPIYYYVNQVNLSFIWNTTRKRKKKNTLVSTPFTICVKCEYLTEFHSMTSLLTHNVAHSTRPFFKPKTNNQHLKKFLSLAFSWVKFVKNWTSFQKIKWFKNRSFQKMSITQGVPLTSNYSMKKILERFG